LVRNHLSEEGKRQTPRMVWGEETPPWVAYKEKGGRGNRKGEYGLRKIGVGTRSISTLGAESLRSCGSVGMCQTEPGGSGAFQRSTTDEGSGGSGWGKRGGGG